MGINDEIIEKIQRLEPVLWINEDVDKFDKIKNVLGMDFKDILEAEERLRRFAPLIKKLFPETEDGIIESPLVEINKFRGIFKDRLEGQRHFLKCDSHLKIAGSIKARGGIYEVLKHAEYIALKAGLLTPSDDYSILAEAEGRELFSKYKIAVGSTGNLGLSIGIISSALGFKVTVHMSRDAKEWKKILLRSKGVVVIEYEDDYSRAVAEGRKQCFMDSHCYFIDDENSKDLFLGYSVAALRLHKQLQEQGIIIDEKHPLYVYLPCGVGGAPGGIAFGLKHVFGDNAHCFFVEPTHSPSMLLGLITGKMEKLHIRDFGIDNITEADGLAVGAPSGLVSKLADKVIEGVYTIDDDELFKCLALLKDLEGIKIEPSAAAGLSGPGLINAPSETIHISWATGGLFLPEDLYDKMYIKGKNLL